MNNSEDKNWPIFEVWKEYQHIAMHFNDLLLKLRIQALAGVTAVSTIIGLFSKSGTGISWEVAAFSFLVLLAFWTAIFLIDSLYYNRLLLGAAEALFELEELSKKQNFVNKIELSTNLNSAVSGNKNVRTSRWNQKRGRFWFYTIVFAVLLIGFCITSYKAFCL